MCYNHNIPHLQVGYNPLIQTIDPNFHGASLAIGRPGWIQDPSLAKGKMPENSWVKFCLRFCKGQNPKQMHGKNPSYLHLP